MQVPFDPVAYINAPRWRHSSLGLDRIALLLDKLGNPQRSLRVIHVGGTNGKGSVCSYLANILHVSGFMVGLFTSPYLERFEERIRVNGCDISADALAAITLDVRDAAESVERTCGEHPTEFELMCAVAFLHFARVGCDYAVVEVGLGGRLDATNVVEPDLSVITRIGLDHTDILGDTLHDIAQEKTGIVKSGVPVVSWPQESEAAEVVKSRCEALGCCLRVADFSKLTCSSLDLKAGVRRFVYQDMPFSTTMLAAYQPFNAVLAIDAAHVLASTYGVGQITECAIRQGIAQTRWPGRFEIVAREPLVVVDGSHNPQGAEALAQSLEELAIGLGGAPASLDGRISFVTGVLADKDYPAILEPLARFAKGFTVYTPDNPRALDAATLAHEVSARWPSIPVEATSSPEQAMVTALEKEGPEGIVVAFGTLYAIGAIKRAVRVWGAGEARAL